MKLFFHLCGNLKKKRARLCLIQCIPNTHHIVSMPPTNPVSTESIHPSWQNRKWRFREKAWDLIQGHRVIKSRRATTLRFLSEFLQLMSLLLPTAMQTSGSTQKGKSRLGTGSWGKRQRRKQSPFLVDGCQCWSSDSDKARKQERRDDTPERMEQRAESGQQKLLRVRGMIKEQTRKWKVIILTFPTIVL